MSQFEYNHLSKFYVSVGVFLIGFAFFLPWLFFRENFDLLITKSDLSIYTDTAQNIIKQRQSLIQYFPFGVMIGFFIFLLLGIILFFIGINGWRKLQRGNEQMEKLKMENQELQNQEITERLKRDITTEIGDPQSPKLKVDIQNKNITGTATIAASDEKEKEVETIHKIPINNAWTLNHWGSDIASILNGKMVFEGLRTRLDSDGCHIDLKEILKIGSFYKVSCFVKALPNTTGQFQLWCHDNVGIEPHCSEAAILYATPSEEGERCSLRFEAKCNRSLRIHLQYRPGEGQIEVSDIRITELKVN